MKELEKIYDPKQVEDKLYKMWEEKGYFHPEVNEKKKPYSIVIPPPNITGQLHMGHALNNTLQDIIIRHKRMQGFATLWLPGTDHASIATEAKIVESMKKEGISKEDIGRESFLERAWDWKEKYGGKIVNQLKKLGSSCDWERERFTLDEGCNKAVNEVFVKLYDKGLIYRGERIINWCPVCKTSISDAEVEYDEKAGHFWHLRYPFADGSGYVLIATTRPETMLGDTAVAVNPKDERYKNLVGKTLILPLVNKEIPLIADDYVEMDFGTGAVKITPAHDPNDFEVGLRHNLECINILNDDATINENGGIYQGLDRYEARKRIVKDLEDSGFLVKIENHTHNVGECYRCSSTVEPRVSKQWFVKMEPLAKPAIDVVKSGEVKFTPQRFEKIYYNWMENIHDWCISRQLWWGHQIPAYYCDDCGEITVSKDTVHECKKCKSKNMRRDEDTLDTWFSSALWPFSTLGWPEKTEDLKYFYPTNTLVTAHDIIFFWVARMIFSAIEHTGVVPFNDIIMHGLVRDDKGRKMSKSLGNGIDPLDIIDKYGADTLRYTLIVGNSTGGDMRFSEEKLLSSRNFCNKLWNASRFILMNLNDNIGEMVNEITLPAILETEDKWIISKLNNITKEVGDNLEKFEMGIAAQKLQEFIWDVLCDWYIEIAKSRLNSEGETANNVKQVLVYIMNTTLKLLHPFMPFITEEIYQVLPHEFESIMISEYPKFNEDYLFEKETAEFEIIIEAIKSIRNRRAEMNVPPSKKAQVFIETEKTEAFLNGKQFIVKLASASEIEIGNHFEISDAVTAVTATAKIYMPLDQLIDFEKELTRLEKEKSTCEKDINMLSGKLSNQGFLAKAPENVIESEKKKLTAAKEKLLKIEQSMKTYEK